MNRYDDYEDEMRELRDLRDEDIDRLLTGKVPPGESMSGLGARLKEVPAVFS